VQQAKEKIEIVIAIQGVCYEKRARKWIAVIYNEGKRIWIGTFETEIDAARAYDEAAKKYHGEFARLNNV